MGIGPTRLLSVLFLLFWGSVEGEREGIHVYYYSDLWSGVLGGSVSLVIAFT